jgi:hypothetical protein
VVAHASRCRGSGTPGGRRPAGRGRSAPVQGDLTGAKAGEVVVEVLIGRLDHAPELVWELSLGIYLMVKGFRPSPITAGTTAATTPPARHEFAT